MKFEIFKLGLWVALGFLISGITILSFQLLAARADNALVINSIRGGLRGGAARFPPREDRDMEIGIDTWDDCLVLSIATYGEKDLISMLTRSNYVSGGAGSIGMFDMGRF